MISDFLRPIISGILGATIGEWLTKRWRRWIPTGLGSKSKKAIMRENAGRIKIANWLSFVGFLSSLAFYLTGYLSKYDWRGVGVGLGLMAGLSILWMIVSSVSGGAKRVQECLIGFAMSQKMPVPILFGLMFICVAGGIVSSVSLFVNPPSRSEPAVPQSPIPPIISLVSI